MTPHTDLTATQSPAPAGPARSRAALLASVRLFALLAARQQAFHHRYAVDVLYWDAWDLYQPLFEHRGWWASFDQQHGPQRQGLGGLWIRFVGPRTRWDCRYDALAVSGALIAAAPLGLWLAWRCGVRGWALVAVPVVYLNTRQYQMFVALANPAHGALPVLLLTAYCLAWFIRRTAWRLTALVALTFCLVFTGFGLFVGLLTPALLGAELALAARREPRRAAAVAVAVVATGLVWVAFAHGYKFDPASDHFRFPYQRPLEYLCFVGTLLANYVGVGNDTTGDPGWGTITLGLAIATAGVMVCVNRGARLLQAGVVGDRASMALFCLSAFGLLFAANAALGRTPDGWRTASESRYVTRSIPTGLAVLLHLSLARGRGPGRAAIVLSALLAVGTAIAQPADAATAQAIRDACLRWRSAYLVTHDQAAADRLARFPIAPWPWPRDRLPFLQSHGLNLFDPDVYGPTDPHLPGHD